MWFIVLGVLFWIGVFILIVKWLKYDYKMQSTISLDNRGYERDGYGQLVHRKVAWKHLYNFSTHPQRFGSYDIHHIDGNKTNNSPDNLQILTRQQHKAIHGIY